MNIERTQHKMNTDEPCEAGHTLTEMVVSMSVFSLAIAGIMACHLAGLRLNLLIQPKIQNAQYARQVLSQMMEEVRSANSIQIGSGTQSSFVAAGITNVQAGNAIRIFPTTNTTRFVYYFHDPNSSSLRKIPVFGTNAFAVTTCVTNDAVFALQDSSGAVLTNSQNNAVLSVSLQMRRNSPIQGDSEPYQVGAKITRRNIL